jgi:hypothetical protein
VYVSGGTPATKDDIQTHALAPLPSLYGADGAFHAGAMLFPFIKPLPSLYGADGARRAAWAVPLNLHLAANA